MDGPHRHMPAKKQTTVMLASNEVNEVSNEERVDALMAQMTELHAMIFQNKQVT